MYYLCSQDRSLSFSIKSKKEMIYSLLLHRVLYSSTVDDLNKHVINCHSPQKNECWTEIEANSVFEKKKKNAFDVFIRSTNLGNEGVTISFTYLRLNIVLILYFGWNKSSVIEWSTKLTLNKFYAGPIIFFFLKTLLEYPFVHVFNLLLD